MSNTNLKEATDSFKNHERIISVLCSIHRGGQSYINTKRQQSVKQWTSLKSIGNETLNNDFL
jgi:endonuclease III-like uncharacterized protein